MDHTQISLGTKDNFYALWKKGPLSMFYYTRTIVNQIKLHEVDCFEQLLMNKGHQMNS